MSEIVLINKKEVKLGTCEDLYYARYRQIREALPNATIVPGNAPPVNYTNPQYGWRYRFPFPDEDGVSIGEHPDFMRGVTITAHISPDTVWCPCQEKNVHSTHSVEITVELRQQKQIDGEFWPVFYCPQCNEGARHPRHMVKPFITVLLKHHDRTFFREIAKRILAGYRGKTY